MRSILIRQMATPTEEPVARATDDITTRCAACGKGVMSKTLTRHHTLYFGQQGLDQLLHIVILEAYIAVESIAGRLLIWEGTYMRGIKLDLRS